MEGVAGLEASWKLLQLPERREVRKPMAVHIPGTPPTDFKKASLHEGYANRSTAYMYKYAVFCQCRYAPITETA